MRICSFSILNAIFSSKGISEAGSFNFALARGAILMGKVREQNNQHCRLSHTSCRIPVLMCAQSLACVLSGPISFSLHMPKALYGAMSMKLYSLGIFSAQVAK